MASAEEVLLQFTAEDNVSDVVSSIQDTVESTISNIVSIMGEINDSVEEVSSNVDLMNDSLSNLESPVLNIEVDDSQIDSAIEKAEELNMDAEIGVNVDDSLIDSAVNKLNDLNKDTNLTANVDDSQITELSAGLSALAGVAGMAGLDEMMDTAGRISDSWNRLDLTFGGVTDNLKANISDVASATGRSGATTRNYFNMMGIAGVTNTEMIGQSFESMAGFAYQSGKDIDTLSSSMQRMVMSGNASARMLGSMGISMNDLANAMGVSAGEVTKAFKALTPEERMNALVKVMGDGTKANEMYKNSWEGTKEKASAEFAGLMGAVGTPILQFMIPVMHQLTSIVETITKVFKSLPAPIQTAVGGILAGAVGLTSFASMIPIFTRAIDGLKNGFGTLGNVVSKLPGIGSKFSIFAKETEEVVQTASGTGKLAGDASKASSGMKATSVSLKGIGQGAMSMLAPLLEIAIVVAVMIPVITALVAEMLLCIKGLQLLIDALDFDSIDLGGAVNGIKQVADALIQVGIAMGAMTFVSIMTGATLWINGLMSIINPVKTAGEMIKQASQELSNLGLADIDPSVVDKIRKVSESLKAVGDAMGDLTGLTLNMAMGNFATLGGLLGNISTAVRTAREEIVNAGREISQIKDLPDIDQSAVDKLKKISDSIKSVSDAFNALRGIRSDVAWDTVVGGLFGGINIQDAINSIKNDLINAGNSLSSLNNLPDIPQDVADKLKKIADSIKSVSDGFNALRKIRDDANWDAFTGGLFGGQDIKTTLENVRRDLTDAGNVLSGLVNLPDIQEGGATKVTRIADATKMVGDALNVMRGANIPDVVTLALMPVKIGVAKSVLQNIGNQLNGLQTLPMVQEGIAMKVNLIASNTQVVGNALSSMNGANIPDIVSLMMLPVRIALAKTVLVNIGNQLNGLQALPMVPEGIATKVNNVANGTRAVASAVSSIQGVPWIGPEAGVKIQMAVSAIKKAMSELSKLNGGEGVNVAGVVGSVRNALNQVRGALNAMRGGFQGSAVGLGSSIVNGMRAGLNPLGGVVRSSVSSAVSGASGQATHGGQQLGTSATNGFRDNLKLGDVAGQEMDNAINQLNNKSGSFYSTVAKIAQEAVRTAKANAGVQSPGYIARMWGQEIGEYSVQRILSGATLLIRTVGDVSRRVVNAWGNPVLGVGTEFNNGLLNAGMVNGVNSMMGSTVGLSNGGDAVKSNGNTYIFNEGAFHIDARNKTESEAKQMLVLALEGLDGMNEDIRGL